MAATRIEVVTPDPQAADEGAIGLVAGSRNSLERLGEFLRNIATGTRSGKVRLNTGAVQAEGNIAFSSFADADTVTINGVTLTGKTSPSGASQWAIGASDEACANNLVAKVNASALDKIVGVVYAYRRGTILLSSFADGDTVTINGVIFTGKTTPSASDPRQFAIGSTDAKTAQNLLAAISAAAAVYFDAIKGANLLSVTRSTATLTIDYDGTLTLAISAHGTATSTKVVFRCLTPGQVGNLMTLAVSAHGTATSPSGGTEGTETIFAINRSVL